jgi:hypothetical protein
MIGLACGTLKSPQANRRSYWLPRRYIERDFSVSAPPNKNNQPTQTPENTMNPVPMSSTSSMLLWTMTRLRFFLLFTFVLLFSSFFLVCPSLYKIFVIIVVSIRILELSINTILPADFQFSAPVEGFNVGWILVVSSASLVVIERLSRYIQACAMNMFQLIPKCKWNRVGHTSVWNECHFAAMVMGMVGMVLIVDKELKMIQMVFSFHTKLSIVRALLYSKGTNDV